MDDRYQGAYGMRQPPPDPPKTVREFLSQRVSNLTAEIAKHEKGLASARKELAEATRALQAAEQTGDDDGNR